MQQEEWEKVARAMYVQGLLVGKLYGDPQVSIEQEHDEQGHYRPSFDVVLQSGRRVRVTVEGVDGHGAAG